MQTKRQDFFTTIKTEGAILPADLLLRVSQGDGELKGLKPADYHLAPGEKINEAINRSWNRMLGLWESFKDAVAKLPETDFATTPTRERWLLPLFQELGYGRLQAARAVEIEGKSYPISHFWSNAPIHLVGCRVDLDRRTSGVAGAARTAPHGLVQEFIGRSDKRLWGFLSNGLRLRILRDNVALTRQAYVEFDLESMMDGEVYSDFTLLWLLCHQSRIEAERPELCWLEQWSKQSQDRGARALDQLRDGVKEAIKALGAGYLAHPANTVLREQLRSGALSTQDYYRQLLRLVYRLLFLSVAEDRDLLLVPEASVNARLRYAQFYSTQRLRNLARRIRGSRHGDLWHSLLLVMRKLHESGCPELGLPALGSFLWQEEQAIPDLAPCQLYNGDLLSAVRALAFIVDRNTLRPVDFKNLRSEELGSVYESLLELHPDIDTGTATFALDVAAGHERKTTGSYYTPDSLVQCLLDSALEPVMDDKEALARKIGKRIADGEIGRTEWSSEELDILLPRGADPDEALAAEMVSYLDLDPAERQRRLAERALLGMRVCDPACGSGHFLISAAHRIARRLARVRTGDEEPSPEAVQHALRDVVGRCLYGVDINPMALELCKVALWMEALEPGKPLSFLDAHLQVGNSLLGTTPELIAQGIPDDAFKPLTGDDKKFCSVLRKRNKQERESAQEEFLTVTGNVIRDEHFAELDAEARRLFEATADTLADVQRLALNYAEFQRSDAFKRARFLADLWCATFVWPKKEPITCQESDYAEPPTQALLTHCLEHSAPGILLSAAQSTVLKGLCNRYGFLHWPVVFADVFRPRSNSNEEGHTGFDCILSNPPWERMKLQEVEWFAGQRPDISDAPNTASRKILIDSLKQEDPEHYGKFLDAVRQAEGETLFLRHSGLYPLCGRGDINSYAVFCEKMRLLQRTGGRLGCITQSDIATSDTCKLFFQDLMRTHTLISLIDFVNTEGLFPAVHRTHPHFCLLTIAAHSQQSSGGFSFWNSNLTHLNEANRWFSLTSDDISLVNPNTHTCPIFRSRSDAELTKSIYRRTPVFKDDSMAGEDIDMIQSQSRWNADITRTFDMARFSEIAKTSVKLEREGLCLLGSRYASKEEWIPILESKLLWQFDHRFATYADVLDIETKKGKCRGLDHCEKLSPEVVVKSRYYLPAPIVARYSEFHNDPYWIAFRDITNTTNERTLVALIIPRHASDYTVRLIFGGRAKGKLAGCLTANLNALPCDYVSRQSLSGTHFSDYIMKQIPIHGPSIYRETFPWIDDSEKLADWVLPRILELTYTAWDLESFARDCDWDGPPFRWDEERRFLLRCELDAAFFHLYLPVESDGDWKPARRADGCPYDETPEQLAELKSHFPTPRRAVEYIMDTFPIVKRKDEKQYGHYRTKDTILEIYDAMQQSIATGQPYQTRLDPPPADPRCCHPPREEEAVPQVLVAAGGEWDESLVAAWDRLGIGRWNYIEDERIFPWHGRESFVYAIIPYLVKAEPGRMFEFYRDTALLASRSRSCETLLLTTDLRNGYRRAIQGISWLRFPDTHRVRPRDIRETLQRGQIIQTDANSGSTILGNHTALPPLPQELQPLIPLILKAGDNLEKAQQSALADAETVKIASELQSLTVAQGDAA